MRKRQFWLILPIITFLVAFTSADVNLKRQNINRRVIMLIPSDFIKLSDENVIKNYGMQKLPLAMFANGIGDVNVTISESIDSLGTSKFSSVKGGKIKHDLSIEKSFRKSSIRANMEKVTFLTDEVREMNKVPFIVLEFESKLIGKNKLNQDVETEMYNYIIYGYRKNRSYIINLAAPLVKKDEWKKYFDEMVLSIQI